MSSIRPNENDMKKYADLHVFLKEELVSRFADVRHNAKQRMRDKYGDFDNYDAVNFDIGIAKILEEVEFVLERGCFASAAYLGIFNNGCLYAKSASRADQ
jgi:hypothetical protein